MADSIAVGLGKEEYQGECVAEEAALPMAAGKQRKGAETRYNYQSPAPMACPSNWPHLLIAH